MGNLAVIPNKTHFPILIPTYSSTFAIIQNHPTGRHLTGFTEELKLLIICKKTKIFTFIGTIHVLVDLIIKKQTLDIIQVKKARIPKFIKILF